MDNHARGSWDEDARSEFLDEVAARSVEYERQLGIPEGFIRGLSEEDDWSFVIKAHALLEAAINDLLIFQLHEPRLSELIAYMELSGAKVGKVAMADALGLLTKGQRRFIRTFSELRNNLVHNVTNVSFSFQTYVEGLQTSQKKSFREAFLFFVTEADVAAAVKERAYTIAERQLKESVWDALVILLADIRVRRSQAELEGLKAEMYIKAGRSLTNNRFDTPPDDKAEGGTA